MLCFAVSQTASPLGTYWIYSFLTTDFPDYFKIGVWPDGYYVSTNENNYNAWVFERAKMIQGLAAQSRKATGFANNLLMPADVDGIVAPPAGAPAIYYTFLDNTFHGGADRLELRAFHVDWVTPANSTFTTVGSPAVAAFTYTVCGFFNFDCAPQPGTAQKVDVLSEWPMFRLAYRRFGDHESLVGNFTVPVGPGGAALVRAAGQRSFMDALPAGHLRSRCDRLPLHGLDRPGPHRLRSRSASSAMSGTVSPAIRFATRLAGDAAGTLGSESTLVAGGGSQTSSNRWDYSAMTIDPADECTFWYTNEYYTASSANAWATRIGAFRVPQCTGLFFDNFETAGTTRWTATAP